jgi:hypothetical protein
MQALYRFYDRHDELLYVGISKNPGERLRGHSSSSSFWRQVATIRIEWHDTRDGVLKAEKVAIKTEGPKYNKMHGTYSKRTDERYRGWVGGPPNAVELAAMIARGEPVELGPTMEIAANSLGVRFIVWDDGVGYVIASIEPEPQVYTMNYGEL